MATDPIDFVSGAPVRGDLDVRWIHGWPSARRNTDPKIQVHAYEPHTFILRQSKAVHYEAPFLYLFCGNDRALLLDTGATGEPALQMTVDQLVAVRDAAASLADRPGRHKFDDVIIFHGPCLRSMPFQITRALWSRLRNRIAALRPNSDLHRA